MVETITILKHGNVIINVQLRIRIVHYSEVHFIECTIYVNWGKIKIEQIRHGWGQFFDIAINREYFFKT